MSINVPISDFTLIYCHLSNQTGDVCRLMRGRVTHSRSRPLLIIVNLKYDDNLTLSLLPLSILRIYQIGT